MKPFSILLLAALFYTQLAYYWQFLAVRAHQREKARKALLSNLPDDRFHRFSTADVDAHGAWQDGGDECWVYGRLYDVIRRKAGIVYCMEDAEEERATDAALELTRQHPDKKAPPVYTGKIGDAIPVARITLATPTARRVSYPPLTVIALRTGSPARQERPPRRPSLPHIF